MGTLGRLIGGLALIIVVGYVVGWVAFEATAPPNIEGYSSMPCLTHVQAAGVDPWTGQPHGLSYWCGEPGTPGAWFRQEAVPANMVGRQAIPVPVGFAVGAAGAAAFLLLTQRRRRLPVPATA